MSDDEHKDDQEQATPISEEAGVEGAHPTEQQRTSYRVEDEELA
jgi:hypothetical protein